MAEQTPQDIPQPKLEEEPTMAEVPNIAAEPQAEVAAQAPKSEAAAPVAIQPKMEGQTQQPDSLMTEVAPSPTPQPTPQQQQASTMPRTSTPNRAVNGAAEPSTIPAVAKKHGASARRYLNQNVSGVLLEGMRMLAIQRPENPLRVLGEYLIMRSQDVEDTVEG